jgi:hypothetical protein
LRRLMGFSLKQSQCWLMVVLRLLRRTLALAGSAWEASSQ